MQASNYYVHFRYHAETPYTVIRTYFQRQECLQSLHAFKGDNLHFDDDNVFSYGMPSKATMSSSTFRRRQCLQSLHVFKRRQCLRLHFEDDNATCLTNVFKQAFKQARRSSQNFYVSRAEPLKKVYDR
ncbi:hypothetical protein JHK82_022561 [Glycine max]|nr:hypothetical protein JHK82_022561 [Glycine max]